MEIPSTATGGVPRVFAVIRALTSVQAEGARVTQLARAVGLTQATTHRLLQSLVSEGIVEQDGRSKLYRLSIEFFALAAHAGNPGDLRTLCRPVLLRLCASLGDSIFLLARSGFDAVCQDRSAIRFDEIAKATFRSITVDTLLKLVDRERKAEAAKAPPTASHSKSKSESRN